MGTLAGAEECLGRWKDPLKAVLGPRGELVVEAVIDGSPAYMVLDTSSTFSKLGENYAKGRSLPIHPSSPGVGQLAGENSFGTGGAAPVGHGVQGTGIGNGGISNENFKDMAHVHTLEFGTESTHEVDFGIVPGGSTSPNSIAGVLGRDVLQKYDIEIDLADHKVNLLQSDHCQGNPAYWAPSHYELPFSFRDGRLWVDLQLEGKSVRATIATGQGMTTMQDGSARRFFGIEEGDSANQPPPAGADPSSFVRTFKTLVLGPLTLNNLPVDVIKLPHFQKTANNEKSMIRQTEKSVYPDVFVGMDTLKQFRLVISYADEKIYFTPAAEAGAVPSH
jgi:hypothetical protein